MIPGRRMPPKLANSVKKVNLITPSELLERIDHYRRHLPDLPNRSEAIRKLIEMGLEAAERKPKGKGKP
jgi:metal-responsive CopG/Arc/MetJ family transcriptional regulator